MASSVSSRGRSPHSPFGGDLNSDTDEPWQYLEYASSGPGSIGFLPSPASGSLNGYAIVGRVGAAVSPAGPPPASPFQLDNFEFAAGENDAFAPTSVPPVGESVSSMSFGADLTGDAFSITPQDLLKLTGDTAQLGHLTGAIDMISKELGHTDAIADAATATLYHGFPPNTSLTPFADFQHGQSDLGIPEMFRADPNAPAWNSELSGRVAAPPASSSSVSAGSPVSTGRLSSSVKSENETLATKAPSPIRKVKDGKIEKKKPLHQEQAGRFVIVTPKSINARAGKPNPFECFEALKTQRGRKGPLANETKENALQVRRRGACFCCHARKVKCDTERPCKSCTKLIAQVPQIVCWQFQDFLPVLFPDFIRGHFKRDEMSKFITENIGSFTVNGVEQPCTVQLYSGSRFNSVLTIRAKFFTAKTDEVLRHWHMHVAQDRINLHSQSAAPLGLDSEGAAQKDEIRKKSKEYIQSIMKEPAYAEQVTESFRHSDLPRRILHVVQNYAIQSENPIVRKALAVYTSHYIMTRHLCLTRQTIQDLQHTNLIAQHLPWVTPRVLNRQIKAIIDEITLKETASLFDHFSKALKPKSRKSWAPCLAAFLVLCLFMEGVETAGDNFVISQAEINLKKQFAPEFERQQALNVNQEIERLPFRQFAYQFHQIYQTHSKDASMRPFNPLVDEAEQGDLDAPAMEMVNCLRQFLQPPSWDELDFLTADPILPNQESHPFPRDVSINYTGRLVSKFLLSFTDEKYMFEGGL